MMKFLSFACKKEAHHVFSGSSGQQYLLDNFYKENGLLRSIYSFNNCCWSLRVEGKNREKTEINNNENSSGGRCRKCSSLQPEVSNNLITFLFRNQSSATNQRLITSSFINSFNQPIPELSLSSGEERGLLLKDRLLLLLFLIRYLPASSYLLQQVYLFVLTRLLAQVVVVFVFSPKSCYRFCPPNIVNNLFIQRKKLDRLGRNLKSKNDLTLLKRFIHSSKNFEIIMEPYVKKYTSDQESGAVKKEHKPSSTTTTKPFFSWSYENAVKALNSTQQQKNAVKKSKIDRKKYDVEKLELTKKYLECIGMTVEDLNELSVIHVAGTKGKGSTCSYVESILRHKGFKTGFFSSPHLKEVRERIRIDGSPISRDQFAKYFSHCQDRIQAVYGDNFPSYFQFLTILGFYVFWREKVDVCIIEVGLGGRYDCTNILRKPVVCGITHLGFDHTHVLGDTIRSIAGHKAGIFKPATTAVTCPQSQEALEVLQENAKQVKCALFMAPDLSEYKDLQTEMEIRNSEEFQQQNISLALQLARIWLQNFDKNPQDRKCVDPFLGEKIPFLDPIIPDPHVIIPALNSTLWPGRTQVLKRQNITYYLDGAHTEDSMKFCSNWFIKKSSAEFKELRCSNPNTKVVKILLFNVTGERNPHNMMSHLQECGFHFALFSPNICYPNKIIEDQNKLADLNVTKNNEEIWLELQRKEPRNIAADNSFFDSCLENSKDKKTSKIFTSISEALSWCHKSQENDFGSEKLLDLKEIPLELKEADYVQVLVTGSIYLVGGVLTIFDSTV